MRAVLLHQAEMEFWASVDYYEEQEPGLGVRFKLEVDQFSAKIEADPMQPRQPPPRHRAFQFDDFMRFGYDLCSQRQSPVAVPELGRWAVQACGSPRANEHERRRIHIA